jgi:hypothetical protein
MVTKRDNMMAGNYGSNTNLIPNYKYLPAQTNPANDNKQTELKKEEGEQTN